MSRHAYLIMAHHNFTQLYRLISFLDSSDADIFLHVDKKAAGFQERQAVQLCKYSTLTLLPRRSLAWGGDSLIKCEIALIKAALSGKYDYYHLISGDDIPLRPLAQIHGFFDANLGKEFVSINWEATNKPNSDIYNRIRQYHVFQNYVGRGSNGMKHFVWKLQLILNKLQTKAKIDRCRNLPFRLGKGSQWFSITHAFAEYTVRNYESVLKKPFFYSVGSDELLIQTTMVNAPKFLEQRYEEGNLRLIDWSRSADGCSPYTFTSEDYDMLMQSGKLWARKVSEAVDSGIIERIYQTIDPQE